MTRLIVSDNRRRWISVYVNRVLCYNVWTRVNDLVINGVIEIRSSRSAATASIDVRGVTSHKVISTK